MSATPHTVDDRWLDPATYNRSWRHRARIAASMFNHEWVCDIGCGRGQVDAYLPLASIYLPADVKQWWPAVELCDLNAGVLPTSIAKADITLLLGVAHALHDLEASLKLIARYSEYLLMSYDTKEENMHKIWRQGHYLSTEVEAIIARAGYHVVSTASAANQALYYAKCYFSDEQIALREMARTHHHKTSRASRTITRGAKRLRFLLSGGR